MNQDDPTIRKHAAAAGGIFEALPPADPRPVMTEKDLSFHTTVAAIQARAAADAAPVSAEARHVVAAAAACEHGGGLLDIAGFTSGPVSIAVMWAMELAEPYLSKLPPVAAADQAILAWVLANPRQALTAAIEGKFQAFADGGYDLAVSGRLSAEQGQAIDEWYTAEVRRLARITGAGDNLGTAAAPGKSEAASST